MVAHYLGFSQQGIEPNIFFSIRATIRGSPSFNLPESRAFVQERRESFFGHIGEMSAILRSIFGAKLERGIKDAFWDQVFGQVSQHCGQVGAAHMQQRRTGPDAFKGVIPCEILEAHLTNRDTSVIARSLHHCGRRIESIDLVAHFPKSACVSARPRSSIENARGVCRISRKCCEKPVTERCHIDIPRVFKKLIGIVVIEFCHQKAEVFLVAVFQLQYSAVNRMHRGKSAGVVDAIGVEARCIEITGSSASESGMVCLA